MLRSSYVNYVCVRDTITYPFLHPPLQPHSVINYLTDLNGSLLCAACDEQLFTHVRGERYVLLNHGATGVARALNPNEFVCDSAPAGAIDINHIKTRYVSMTSPTTSSCPKCSSRRVHPLTWDEKSPPVKMVTAYGPCLLGRVLTLSCKVREVWELSAPGC